MSKFTDKLMKFFKEEFNAFIAAGDMVAKILLHLALDMSDTSSRIMASCVTMRTALWLQNTV